MKLRLYLLIASIPILLCVILLTSNIRFHFHDSWEGFFILQGENKHWLELSNDLVPEDAGRVIWAMPHYPFRKLIVSSKCSDTSQSCIDFTWDKVTGDGSIKNIWPDGRKLVINLSRFKDSNGKYPEGVFIGGGLPPSDPDYRFLNNEATGMTYFDGKRWYHIWCNANEGLISATDNSVVSYPSDWTFKGSRVLENTGRHLTIESRHSLVLAGVPMDVQRIIFYTAGNSYVLLSTEFTNRGKTPLPFIYMYGDEPWIGYFGSSAGDVGWMERELILTEREIDTKKHTYFGMFDYGNELAGEEHRFTGFANFIEWNKASRPNIAYISNDGRGVREPKKVVPLASPDNRFIGLQYGPYHLQPAESFSFTIAIGMAGRDPSTGFPVKPKTELNP